MTGIAKVATRATLALVAGLAATSTPSAADSVAGRWPRVPIKLRVNKSENKLVYSSTVRFGSTQLEAVLDTGSMPLLVLKGHVPPHDAQPTGATYSITYGGDRTYDSNVVQGSVRIGPASGAIAFGVVSAVRCVPAGSTCPISGEGPHDARFAGLYPAIIGARITAESGASLQPTFRELGVHRFILTAPRQREGDGALQLDPNTNETSRFVSIALATPAAGVPSGSVRGCLRDKTNGASFCGAVFLDTGRTGVTVVPASGNTQSVTWNAKDAAQLEFTDANGAEIAGVDFGVGVDDPTKVVFTPPGSSGQVILYVGQLPYLGLSILTDLDDSAYAVSPRPKAPDGVVGHVP